MKVAYVGNHLPEHSTENHVRQAFENQGHQVVRVQEGDEQAYGALFLGMQRVDMILWTRTADLAQKWGHKRQLELLSRAKSLGIPTVGFHLDRWWGLDREAAVWTEPFFRCEYVITADGGHQDEFHSVGVNHFWLPPAVSLGETVPGEPQERFTSDIAFVGSWQSGYHKEWTHRPQLVDWLSKTYPQLVKFWPRPNEHAIRGKDLRDLYASVKVVVGDSCLAGNAHHYISDRVPETIGRGGFLIHPHVVGVTDGTHYTAGEHLWTWPIGDWSQLKQSIDSALATPDTRAEVQAAGRQHVIENHTYDTRVWEILEVIRK